MVTTYRIEVWFPEPTNDLYFLQGSSPPKPRESRSGKVARLSNTILRESEGPKWNIHGCWIIGLAPQLLIFCDPGWWRSILVFFGIPGIFPASDDSVGVNSFRPFLCLISHHLMINPQHYKFRVNTEKYNHLVTMKAIALVLCLLGLSFAFVFVDHPCPETKQIQCIDDIRAAYPACQKAIDEGGSDMIADLTCLKYFTNVKSDCWPCICHIAEMDHIKVKGCWYDYSKHIILRMLREDWGEKLWVNMWLLGLFLLFRAFDSSGNYELSQKLNGGS